MPTDADATPAVPGPKAVEDPRELRAAAVKRLQERRGLMAHTLAYATVNLLLVAVWVATGAGFFWPLFPIFGWGIGLAFHAWGVFWPEPDEARIDREIERIRRRRDDRTAPPPAV